MTTAIAESRSDVVLDVTLVPNYQLPRRAANRVRPWPQTERRPTPWLATPSTALELYGQAPTDRRTDFELGAPLAGDFTAELWICDHVNRDVGCLLRLLPEVGSTHDIALSYWDDEVRVGLRDGSGAKASFGRRQKFKKYWLHVALVRRGAEVSLFVNGAPQAQLTQSARTIRDIELAGYFANEPFMELGNLVHAMRITQRALSADELLRSVAQHRDRVARGVVMDQFHFNAGPALQYPTPTSLGLLWETDRPSSATVRYGRSAELSATIELPMDEQLIREVRLPNLEPATPYFYEITAKDASGSEIRSGLLTARTAVADGQPFVFGIIGDTEARPHINARLAEALWRERVDFVINAGDLTDGGREPHKFEWNLEYFVGMGSLLARVPTMPVPGNGEGDLYWYNRYHTLPEPEAYYTFRYGDVQFFMLDSNQAEQDFAAGGTQYEWLKAELAASDARWKIAAHHHPTWSSEQDDYGNTWKESSRMGDTRVRQIIELYESGGIDVVIFGHLHAYQRSFELIGQTTVGANADGTRGITYIQVGGAGGNLADLAPTRNWFQAKSYPGAHHYLTAEVTHDLLKFSTFDVSGRMRDAFEITKRD